MVSVSVLCIVAFEYHTFLGSKSYTNALSSNANSYNIFDIRCHGIEMNLSDCNYNFLSSLTCSSAVAVLCQKS